MGALISNKNSLHKSKSIALVLFALALLPSNAAQLRTLATAIEEFTPTSMRVTWSSAQTDPRYEYGIYVLSQTGKKTEIFLDKVDGPRGEYIHNNVDPRTVRNYEVRQLSKRAADKTDFTALADSTYAIRLLWNRTVPDEYEIYYSTSFNERGTGYVFLTQVTTDTSFLHADLNPHTTYYYILYRINGGNKTLVSTSYAATDKQPVRVGVYVGILSFAFGSKNITSEPVYLDDGGKRYLKRLLNNYYYRSNATGTALYDGVDRVLENLALYQQRAFFPPDVEAISLITVSASADTASEHTDIQQQLRDQVRDGVRFRAFAVGAPGQETYDLRQFTVSLANVTTGNSDAFMLSSIVGATSALHRVASFLEKPATAQNTSIIYLALDSSLTLTVDEVDEIREATKEMLETLLPSPSPMPSPLFPTGNGEVVLFELPPQGPTVPPYTHPPVMPPVATTPSYPLPTTLVPTYQPPAAPSPPPQSGANSYPPAAAPPQSGGNGYPSTNTPIFIVSPLGSKN